MSKQAALSALAEELRTEISQSSVTVMDGGKAAFIDADEKKHNLSGADAALFFHSKDTVDRFLELFDDTDECSLELYSLTLDTDVTDYLERCLLAVDDL